jgi:hypothetical protein
MDSNDKDLLQSLVGWKCSCCGAVHSPTEKFCIFCIPYFRRTMLRLLTPDADMTFFHDCPVTK